MRWLKRLGLALLVLVGVVLGGGMLLPSTFEIARSTQVAAAPDKVYALVASPRHWPRWSVWNQRDPAMQLSFSGPDSGPGAAWAWKSASEGNGSMRFLAAEPGRSIDFELNFEGFDKPSPGRFRFEPDGGGTRVTWTMRGDTGGNPLMRWFALVADRLAGADFAAGLANLKTLAERP